MSTDDNRFHHLAAGITSAPRENREKNANSLELVDEH